MIDKLKYKNITNAKKYFSNLLKQYNENINFNNNEILELLEYHPTKDIKKENIEYLVMKKRPPYYKIALYYKINNKLDERDSGANPHINGTSSVSDISYIECLKVLYNKYNKEDNIIYDINQALRNISERGTKKDYKLLALQNNNNICTNCNIKTNKLETDHYPIPYKKILDDFIKDNNINLPKLKYKKINNIYYLDDKTLSNKFLNYHDKTAKYRLLCKSCNCHFGSYGY
jgi:hypothetical protein